VVGPESVEGPGAEDALAEALAAAEKKNAELDAKTHELSAAHEELKQELEATRAELTALRAEQAPAEEPAEKAGPRLSVDYGQWGELDVLKSADWKKMGGAMMAMLDMMPKLYETIAAGEQPSAEVQTALGRENTKLLIFAIEVMGKLPTSVTQTGNGAFTHPIVFANLLVEHLELEGQALTGPQLLALNRLGDEYDAAWDVAQSRYGEQTYTLRRLLDELTLKLVFYDGTIVLLDRTQRSLVVRPTIQHRAGLDLYSPVLMLSGVARGKRVSSPDALRAMLEREARSWGFAADALAEQGDVFDTWARELALTAVTNGDVPFCTLGEAMTALGAQIHAMSELELRLAPGDDVRAKMRGLTGYPLPRLVAAGD
jgi:hypothetical protein